MTRSLARSLLALGVVSIGLQFAAYSKQSEAANRPATPVQPEEQIYRSLDGQRVIALVSSDELEVRRDGENIVCKYTEKENRLRVLVNESGSTRALYFNVTPTGLVDEQGEILYDADAYQKTLAQVDELKALLKKAFEMKDFSELEAQYGKDGPPEVLMKTAMQGVMTNAGMRELVSRAARQSETHACINNLRQIDGAKDQWAIENNKVDSDTVAATSISMYIKGGWPTCPAGGRYSVTTVRDDPVCSLGGEHSLSTPVAEESGPYLSAEQKVRVCINHLRQIAAARDQWAIENNKMADGDQVTSADLAPYIKGGWPTCPAGGQYSVTTVNKNPTCSKSAEGHILE